MSGQTGTNEPTVGVEGAFADLIGAVGELENALHVMHDRLGPFLLPDEPQPEKNPCETLSEGSVLRSQLCSIKRDLHRLRDYTTAMMQRVDS